MWMNTVVFPKADELNLSWALAQAAINQGKGAKRRSANADSYVWLANGLYFYTSRSTSTSQRGTKNRLYMGSKAISR